jgi:membrane protease subunit HflC
MSRRLIALGIAVIVLGIVVADAFFTVDETQQALVLQFGQHRRTVQEPGLHVKVPFLQGVVYYDDRVLNVDPPAQQVTLADQRRLDVDTLVRYRIDDPREFYRTVNNEATANQRLLSTVTSTLRDVLGSVTQLDILSERRAEIMNRIRAQVEEEATRFGMDITDVRIVRADIPETTLQSVYDRMRSERQREAAEARARGEEQARQIRARADREATVLLAEAERRAQILRGEGDAEAIRIQAEAYGSDPEFFSFYRTLQAYRQALRDDDTTLVLSPNSDFFRFFQDIDQRGVLPGGGLPRLDGGPGAASGDGGLTTVPPVTEAEAAPRVLTPAPVDEPAPAPQPGG